MKGEMCLPEPISGGVVPKPDHMLTFRNIDLIHMVMGDGEPYVLLSLDTAEGSYGGLLAPEDFMQFADMVEQIRDSLL